MVVTMDYRIEIYDNANRRVAAYDNVLLFETTRRAPDAGDSIAGLLPVELENLGPGWTVRVIVDGKLFCRAVVTETAPQWSDTRKLILEKYVTFQELMAFTAARPRA
jgi:hypothetical protein